MLGWLKRILFRSEPNTTDFLKSETIACVGQIKEKWIYFDKTLPFKSDVMLSQKIEAFASPIQAFVQTNYPSLMSSPNFSGKHFWMMIFTAILESKTHPAEQVNEAIDQLGKKFAR